MTLDYCGDDSICSGHAAKLSKRLVYFPGWLLHEVVPADRISNDTRVDHLSTVFPYPITQEWLEFWFVSPNEHASALPGVEALRNTD